MVKVACLMMQRDEELLLRPWLLYYGYLFGFENLYVYDNGSTINDIKQTLNEFSSVGVNVDITHNTSADFEHKGVILGNKIHEFKQDKRYDIVLPLDCDEFIAMNGRFGFDCNRTEIIDELERIHNGGVVCRTSYCLDNRPGFLDLFRYVPHTKSIVIVEHFLGIDHGFHQASLPEGAAYGQTALIHIHMHFKPFKQVLEGAKNKLAPFVDVEDTEALKGFSGVGNHLKKYFFMSDFEYYSQLHGYQWPLIRFSKFQKLIGLLLDIGKLKPQWEYGRPINLLDETLIADLDRSPFISSEYHAANQDLPRSNYDAFSHFISAGYMEGRRLRPSTEGFDEAVDRLEQIRQIRLDGKSGFVGLAFTMSRSSKASGTEAILLDGLKTFGKTKPLLRELALSAMYSGALELASTRWFEFRSLFPDEVDGYHFEAYSLRLQGSISQAELVVNRGLQIFPQNMALEIELAELAVARRAWEQASELWYSLHNRFPNNQEIRERAASTSYSLRLWRSEQQQTKEDDTLD